MKNGYNVTSVKWSSEVEHEQFLYLRLIEKLKLLPPEPRTFFSIHRDAVPIYHRGTVSLSFMDGFFEM